MRTTLTLLIALSLTLGGTALAQVAHYTLDGNANDVVGGNDGTVHGASPTTDRFGNANSAYEFDGLDDFIEIPGGFLPSGSSPRTFAAWVYTYDNTLPEQAIVQYGTTGQRKCIRFEIEGGRLALRSYSDDHLSQSLSANTWYHVAATYDGSTTLKFYVNGDSVETEHFGGSLSTQLGYYQECIGGGGPDGTGSESFYGKIDDVYIFDRSLSTDEIAELYGVGPEIPHQLVAHWPMDGSGSLVEDISGRGHDGFATGTSSVAGCDGNGRYFSSVADHIEVPHSSDFEFNDMTIAYRIKLDYIPPIEGKILTKATSYSSPTLYTTSIGRFGQVSFGIVDNTVDNRINSVTTLEPGRCYCVSVTRAVDTLRIYINGVLDATVTGADTRTLDDPDQITIGYRDLGSDQPFPGIIDDLRLYNYALDREEIRGLCGDDCTDNTPPDAAYSFAPAGDLHGAQWFDDRYHVKQHQLLEWDGASTWDLQESSESLHYAWPFGHHGHSQFEVFGISVLGEYDAELIVTDACDASDSHYHELTIEPVQWYQAKPFGLYYHSLRPDSWEIGETVELRYCLDYMRGTLDVENEWSEVREAFSAWERFTYDYVDAAGTQHTNVPFVSFSETYNPFEADIFVLGWSFATHLPWEDGLAATFYWPRPFIFLNDWMAWSTEDPGETGNPDIRAVMVHEIGHALGLDHNDDSPEDVMYSANKNQRQLAFNDVSGFLWLYGPSESDLEGVQSYKTSPQHFLPFTGDLLPPEPENSNDGQSVNSLRVQVACPVDVELVDPLGRVLNKDMSEVDSAMYLELDLLPDGGPEKYLVIPSVLSGIYGIAVSATPEAESTSTYSISVMTAADSVVLADRVPVFDIPSEGYLFSTLDTGSIAGAVSSEGTGLLGVPVDLYDAANSVIASAISDESGAYEFAGLDNGNYSVSISTPLGYQADEETKTVEVRGLPHEVIFELTTLEITPQQRSRGYWAHQLLKALQNKAKDYTIDDFAGFAGLINVHFNQNQLNPVDFYSVPQPASQSDSLDVLKTLLHMGNVGDEHEAMLKRLARAQLMALMLNVVSGKVSQTHAVSADGRKVSQAVTYCDMLVSDEIDPPVGEHLPGYGSPWFRYIYASVILGFANLDITVPAGMIPEDVMQIAYKTGDAGPLPEGFALSQNYPNPFNPITEISFSLPKASVARLEIFNIMGQRVSTLVDGMLQSGEHSAIWNASNVSSGVYFYRLTAGEAVATRKMVLLK